MGILKYFGCIYVLKIKNSLKMLCRNQKHHNMTEVTVRYRKVGCHIGKWIFEKIRLHVLKMGENKLRV